MTLPNFNHLAGLVTDGKAPRKPICAALDIGTHKISCMIAKVRARPGAGEGGGGYDFKVIGTGHQASKGVKAGVIVDLGATENAIRAAVDAAEKMARVTVDEVVVNVSCGRLSSDAFEIGIDVPGRQVRTQDIDRLLKTARARRRADQRLTLHSFPMGYALDENVGLKDPCGMYGDRLRVGMHLVTAEPGPLRNLAIGIDRCHLNVDRVAASPLASAIATITADEADLGVLCVDMGAGCTTLAVFMEGMFVHADAIALGGGHVTLDLARGLSMPLSCAERAKTLHASALQSPSDERELVEIETVGSELPDQAQITDQGNGVARVRVPRALLTGIAAPRVEEIFELLRDRLKSAGLGEIGEQRVVLTGGASQLTGVREVAAQILGGTARRAVPRPLGGVSEVMGGPAFACLAGLVTYAQTAEREPGARLGRPQTQSESGYLARVGHWLKESF
ncbi:MAG: cell division protein FtsA [Alphaproteobacteria bacterium]